MGVSLINTNKTVELKTPELGGAASSTKAEPQNTSSTLSSLGSNNLPTNADKVNWQVEKDLLQAEWQRRHDQYWGWPWYQRAALGTGYFIEQTLLEEKIQALGNKIQQPTREELTAERDALVAQRQKLIDEFIQGKEKKFEQYKEEFENAITSKTGSKMAQDFWVDAFKLLLAKLGPIDTQIQRIDIQLRTGLVVNIPWMNDRLL